VVRTLSRAIETDRVAHAYLFSGPRGTGKTSTAKVLAMGLNCEKGPTPEPDGTCESCRAIVNNSSMDVLEMDAASNRGIDEIRDLRDRVNLAPTQGRMKVYIIDEVHMLTTEAFNALLKMLEEPPEHVVFVLATTEKHKVLPTIISRCQSFDFRRPGVSLLSEKLREISEAEGIEVEPASLTLIAREGRGSFRTSSPRSRMAPLPPRVSGNSWAAPARRRCWRRRKPSTSGGLRTPCASWTGSRTRGKISHGSSASSSRTSDASCSCRTPPRLRSRRLAVRRGRT
jgi:DNA polymerase III delta' subunit